MGKSLRNPKHKNGREMRKLLVLALADVTSLYFRYPEYYADLAKVSHVIISIHAQSFHMSIIECLEAVESFGELCLFACSLKTYDLFVACYNVYIRKLNPHCSNVHTVVMRLSDLPIFDTATDTVEYDIKHNKENTQ